MYNIKNVVACQNDASWRRFCRLIKKETPRLRRGRVKAQRTWRHCSQSKQQRQFFLPSVFIRGMWHRGYTQMSKGCCHHNQLSQRWEHVSSGGGHKVIRTLCSPILSLSLRPPPAPLWANRPFPSASAISKCQSNRESNCGRHILNNHCGVSLRLAEGRRQETSLLKSH